MCMISILKPLSSLKKEVDTTYFKNALEHNSDGCGFAYIENIGEKTKIKIIKGLCKFDRFIELLLSKRAEHPDSFFLVHQRNATAGLVDYHSCHPFNVGHLAMAHNGTIHKLKSHLKTEPSDSNALANMIKEFPSDWYHESKVDAFTLLLEDYIGTNNRLAFLLPNNTYFTIGETGWHEHDEVVFSNTYYVKNTLPFTTTNNTNNIYEETKNKHSTITHTGEKCVDCGALNAYIIYKDKKYCEDCYTKSKKSGTHPSYCLSCGEVLPINNISGYCITCDIY